MEFAVNDGKNNTVISVDLLNAWERSDAKVDGWNRGDAISSIERYRKFLLLIASHPNLSFAPTRDIDEMWHLHMLSPRAYQEDCTRLFGEVLDHNGGFGKGEGELPVLQAVFERTARMWEDRYGEPYLTENSAGLTKCWHDCVSRCWHACSSKVDPIFQSQQDNNGMTKHALQ